MTATILRGDAAHLPLADASVDLVVTSPPYFGLRSYTDGGVHYQGQVGDEATPAEYLDALTACTAEWVRVLKPGGSIFVNLGDKYAGGGGQWEKDERPDPNNLRTKKTSGGTRAAYTGGKAWGHKPKTLIGLPWRYALRCIDDLGLILRAEIVWAKPNGLPESVTDRVRRSHEQVFHFVKQPRYFSAVDEVREAHQTSGGKSWEQRKADGVTWTPGIGTRGTHMEPGQITNGNMAGNPLGKLPGSVWTIPTSPLTVPDHLGVDHFAAYPPELVRRIVLGWSPRGACSDCGFLLGSSYDKGMLGVRAGHGSGTATGSAPEVLLEALRESPYSEESDDNALSQADDSRIRRGVAAGSPDGAEVGLPDGAPARHGGTSGSTARAARGRAPHQRDQDGQPDRELGTARQGRARQAAEAHPQAVPVPALRRSHSDVRDLVPCPHCGGSRVVPAVIVDPFGGTGTTALVASCYGRHGISVDLSADYCRLATWRTTDPGERARVLGVAKPPPQVDGQLGMFEGIGA